MSSSKKKQLRKEQYMTERQTAAAKEAKKLKRYTLTFWVVILVIASIFVGAVAANPVKNMMYKNTKAMQVGDYTLSSVDVNYYYIDAINQFVSQNQTYIQIMMDTTKPLNEQVYNKETGATWADTFVDSAKAAIRSTYAVYDAAIKAGHKLTEAEQKSIETNISNASLYAMYYGYNNLTAYLRAMYGNGATEESYRNYLEVSAVANSYMAAHSDSLEYTAEDLKAFQETNPHRYNSYTFATYYVNASSYRTGGTKDDKGNTTYTDEEKAAAVKAAEAAANLLAGGDYADLAAFNAAIKGLPVNAENPSAAATENKAVLFDDLSTLFQDWIIGKVESEDKDAEPTYVLRKEGDMTVIENASGTGDSKVINGYYVVRFGSMTMNDFAMKDVRHVLIKFEGGKTNSSTGVTTYTDEEKETAKEKAEKLLADWVAAGDLSEESFAELAKKNSKDGNAAQGGLYEKVYPGQMVEPFENWLYDAERKVGDYGIVETQYGYHIMFFVGDNEQTFRDFMITNVKRNEDMETWQNGLMEKLTVEVLTLKHLELDMILSH